MHFLLMTGTIGDIPMYIWDRYPDSSSITPRIFVKMSTFVYINWDVDAIVSYFWFTISSPPLIRISKMVSSLDRDKAQEWCQLIESTHALYTCACIQAIFLFDPQLLSFSLGCFYRASRIPVPVFLLACASEQACGVTSSMSFVIAP